MSDYRFNRRHFFLGALLAGAVPRVGFGSQPSLKALGYKSPNEKLGIACIGLGMTSGRPGARAGTWPEIQYVVLALRAPLRCQAGDGLRSWRVVERTIAGFELLEQSVGVVQHRAYSAAASSKRPEYLYRMPSEFSAS